MDSMDGDDTIYRPLLFYSTGYSSSQMLLDDDAFRQNRQQHNEDIDGNEPHNPLLQGPLAPRLRLETLSSTAASAVLGLTYIAFCVAIALPYLHTIGYLSKVEPLSGELCSPNFHQNACTYIDLEPHGGKNAWWTANVSNVSWLAGSMSLDLEPRGVNVTSETSFVLEYDVFVYGGGHSAQVDKSTDYIFARYNQSVWLHCPGGICGRTTLFDVSQDNEGLGGAGYGSYLIVVFYHSYYPHLFARAVDYFFSYTAPAMHVSELVVRAVLVAATIAFLPWWSYQTFQGSSGARPIHTRVLWLGLVLVLYQNPIFMLAQWFRTVDDGTRFAANLCQTISTTCVRLAWLFLMDHPLSASSAWWKVVYGVVHVAMSLCMCVLRFPRLFSIAQHESTFVLLGFAMIFLTWTWLFWLRSICLRTMATLNDKLMYMTSRDQQLSYRFLFLELVLVIVYVGMSSIAQVVSLVREWILYGTAPFVLAAVSSFSGTGAGQVVPVEQILFVSMVVYMTMVVHLPPVESATSTARFYIEEAHYASARNPRLSHFGHRHPSQYDDSALFCLETAEWLVQLAWQAYMDPLGNPSASGNGVQALETFGFELIVHLRHELLDTQAIVCMHRTRKRLVVAFRGSVSKAHWKTNLRFHQVPLWMQSMQGMARSSRQQSCKDRAMRWASRMPLLNLALPRVHSGTTVEFDPSWISKSCHRTSH
ncbi:hypothetical protein, variant [Aphanomyces invadans]|uniref:Uncharacterized protein n=1 Tax=Aphanomyces invadans TaxID=157072 RepID=A0A024UAM5_9STRA|nr:hypothetical protein, variant [Aphanomyces invadans]ETW03324.1 hypothetical protein, variant [Aphanomyces invadans]|eukprot:XP_008867553.1 hypothetical protein, variant [Aphanomyces invadans]